MRKVLTVVCGLLSAGLVILIVWRISTGATGRREREEKLRATGMEMVDAYARVDTRPLSASDYGRVVREQSSAISKELSTLQLERLLVKADEFYTCYSSGRFEEYKRFRINGEYSVGAAFAGAVRRNASEKGIVLKSEEDLLRWAWEHYNGTNKISQVDSSSIRLSIARRNDSGRDLLRPSIGRSNQLAAICWEGAVVYTPDLGELLKRDGKVTYATLESFVRFDQIVNNGPATPLRLICYWDPERQDWMPLAMCTTVQVAGYETIF